ncbi:MAG: Ig-like domain-containing protein [Methanospirillum sp.]|nr:Ig-like domain-containing protein [Methanospirillum sp.]
MKSEQQIRPSEMAGRMIIPVILFCGVFLLLAVPVVAVEGFPETHSGNSYEGWDLDLVSRIDAGIFPMVEVTWTPEPDDTAIPKSSTDHWVKLAYFPPGSLEGQPALLSGYVGGRFYNAEVTVTGKRKVNDEFHDIVTITPEENGVFVWAVPDALRDVTYFQAVAKVGGIPVKSEIVTTSGPSGYVPAGSGSSSASSAERDPLPAITRMKLSADTLHPDVGDEVQLTGRLTDSNGKGVAGVKITIEVPDLGTDFLPLTSATTDSDGSYTVTINTWQEGVVPVRAVFEGNDEYLASTSNTLNFSTSTQKTNPKITETDDDENPFGRMSAIGIGAPTNL